MSSSSRYTDSLGVGIPAVTAGLGQISIGPGISYHYTADGDVVIDTGLRFDAVADILNTSSFHGFSNLHGRIEGTINLSLPGGSSIGLSAAYDGIGIYKSALSTRVRLNVPLD